MSNDVQSHETRVERSVGERRANLRHAAASLGSVTARIIGGSQVDLVNFSSRGVLFECDSRLLIGARASVRLTTMDDNLIVTGRVVRSRVKGLINGALRYDAALMLDHELALTPSIAAALAPVMSDELDADQVAFESAFDSPVEAYLAESEASLAEVAESARPVGFEPTSVDMTAVEAAPELPPVEFETNAVPEFVSEPAAEDEPVAFEADADVAFEPVDELVFDDAGEPVFDAAPAVSHIDADAQAEAVAAIERAAAESAGSSMFDATPYVAVVEDVPAPDSMFEVTPPTPVHGASTSSFFDSRPSETYGEAPLDVPVASPYAETPAEDAAAAVAAVADTPALAGPISDPSADPIAEAGDAIDFETEIAFEPEDAAMFEAAFEDAPVVDLPVVGLPVLDLAVLDAGDASVAIADPVVADPVIAEPAIAEPAIAELAIAEPITVESVSLESTGDPADPDVADAALDESIDLPAVVPEREDRVLLQFAATVPHDLAELRRIAADNQW